MRLSLRSLALATLTVAVAHAQPSTPEPTPAPSAPAPSAPAPSAPAPSAPAPSSSSSSSSSPTPPPVAPPEDLQSPTQVSTRNSAYSLPRGMWAFNAGALGIGGGDAFATLGVTYGIGAGLQAEMNLAHVSVGLLNVGTSWHFIDTRYFDLGARVGFWYGRGKWFWIARGVTKEVVSKLDVLNLPLELTASAPLSRFLELDLGVLYNYGEIFGSLGTEDNPFIEAQLGVRQLAFRPGMRLFVSDGTALEGFAKLPATTTLPLERVDDVKVPFKDAWSLEVGLRSRFAPGLFGNVRLHYGASVDAIYGARLYPSFEFEYRL